MVHHVDIGTATRLALSRALDGRIVNIGDDAPTSLHELVELAGASMAPVAEPLASPLAPSYGRLARQAARFPARRQNCPSGRRAGCDVKPGAAIR